MRHLEKGFRPWMRKHSARLFIDLKVVPEVVTDVMAGLNREEKIPHWGISESNEVYLRQVHAVCPVTAVENRYSMMACVLGRTTVTGRTTSTCCVAG